MRSKHRNNFPKAIAIDGPAASGKSTIGQELAQRMGFLFLDTGIMYRAVTWAALEKQVAISDEKEVSEVARQINIEIKPASIQDTRQCDVLVDGMDVTWLIRNAAVNENVSQVSAYEGVRAAMTAQQKIVGAKGNIVMVGRDIGTVVLPDADLKIFLEASAEERAKRRHAEVIGRKGTETFQEILDSMKKRDEIDSKRSLAPLKPAPDAHIIKTDGKNKDEVMQEILNLIYSKKIEE
jgi:cytidylate kinase